MADPGFPVGGVCTHWGGVDLQHGHFSVKMYAKTKELGPIGGVCRARPPPLDPPMGGVCVCMYVCVCVVGWGVVVP